jgi:hypothetical protein
MSRRQSGSRAPWRLLVGLWLCACGGDDDVASQAVRACGAIVEGYARGWERCERSTYEEARDLFADALGCEDAQAHDDTELQDCLEQIDGLTCDDLARGVTPSPCRQILQD